MPLEVWISQTINVCGLGFSKFPNFGETLRIVFIFKMIECFGRGRKLTSYVTAVFKMEKKFLAKLTKSAIFSWLLDTCPLKDTVKC